MFICAGRNETFPFAQTIGVGLIESAINLTRYCLFDRPDSLIFIGSAGSYGNYDLLDIVETNSASNIELSYLQQKSYTPLDNVIQNENATGDATVSRGTSKKPTIVNSSNYISTDEALGKTFLKLGIGLENMEFFSVLSVAKELEIPAKGIFVVTNHCNQNAHEEFLKNHQKAMLRLMEYLQVKRYL